MYASCFQSLHVCEVCGWSKMTTYRGLRVHQGKKGCIPKGKKIPQTEQGKPPKLREMEVKVERRRQSTRKLNFNEEVRLFKIIVNMLCLHLAQSSFHLEVKWTHSVIMILNIIWTPTFHLNVIEFAKSTEQDGQSELCRSHNQQRIQFRYEHHNPTKTTSWLKVTTWEKMEMLKLALIRSFHNSSCCFPALYPTIHKVKASLSAAAGVLHTSTGTTHSQIVKILPSKWYMMQRNLGLISIRWPDQSGSLQQLNHQ